MVWVAFAFFAIFVLILSGGLLLFYREAAIQRIAEVIDPRSAKPQRTLTGMIQGAGSSMADFVQRMEQLMPKSQAEVSVVSQRLIRAGYRNESAVKIFYGGKVLTPIALCLVALVTGLASKNPFLVYAMALALGYLLPDFWLGRLIKKRQKLIERGLPDVLDLLVICVEAGLSLDQATARTAEELAKAHPELCDELGVVVLEQRAGRARADAWKSMADRTDVDSLRNLVSVLIQSEQLGTSIAKTLRVHGDTMRTKRVQAIEEMAAKTSVKLVFPLVFFIFPALFVVVLGPAAILIMEQLGRMAHH